MNHKKKPGVLVYKDGARKRGGWDWNARPQGRRTGRPAEEVTSPPVDLI